jgi:hypothetical protein
MQLGHLGFQTFFWGSNSQALARGGAQKGTEIGGEVGKREERY